MRCRGTSWHKVGSPALTSVNPWCLTDRDYVPYINQSVENALFLAPHAIAVDSRGDLYVGDVSWAHNKIDRGPNVVRKFARRT